MPLFTAKCDDSVRIVGNSEFTDPSSRFTHYRLSVFPRQNQLGIKDWAVLVKARSCPGRSANAGVLLRIYVDGRLYDFQATLLRSAVTPHRAGKPKPTD